MFLSFFVINSGTIILLAIVWVIAMYVGMKLNNVKFLKKKFVQDGSKQEEKSPIVQSNISANSEVVLKFNIIGEIKEEKQFDKMAGVILDILDWQNGSYKNNPALLEKSLEGVTLDTREKQVSSKAENQEGPVILEEEQYIIIGKK